MRRMPVKYQGIPLMPMKTSRVELFVNSGKGRIRYDRKLKVRYLQLLVEPSGFDTQKIALGIDPGSEFDGFSVVSKDTHHCNFELIQRPKKGKDSIKYFKKRQAKNRRERRRRLRHRRTRFDNRTSKKLAPTIRANVEYRKWLISKLCKLYPISHVVIEDVRFNHYTKRNGRSFSLVEQGKTELYNWIKNQGLTLETFNGFETHKLRINSFGFDPKVKSKGDRSFEAHCIDSFVLACDKYYKVDHDTGELFIDQPVIDNDIDINRKVTFIRKIVKQRRWLYRLRRKYNDAKYYYRLKPGGIKEYYNNYSSHRKVCRIKPPGVTHSNHPKEWIYKDHGFAQRYKSSTTKIGGTVFNGEQKSYKNGEWKNREVTVS